MTSDRVAGCTQTMTVELFTMLYNPKSFLHPVVCFYNGPYSVVCISILMQRHIKLSALQKNYMPSKSVCRYFRYSGFLSWNSPEALNVGVLSDVFFYEPAHR